MTLERNRSGTGISLSLAPTASTPAVEGDWERGVLRMFGESYPENTYEMFGEIIAWIDAYLGECDRPLMVELELNYLNTSSVRAMIDVFDRLQLAHDGGRAVSVGWFYDARNPRSAEMGEEFKQDYSFAFSITVLGDA